MAAIDKIYINKFEDYLLFKDWCNNQPKIKDKYGSECSISDYLYQWKSFEDNKEYPILKLAKTNKFHDRFVVIDNKEMYHLGASIKDLGKNVLEFQDK